MKKRNIVIGIAWLLYTASWFIQVIKDGTTLSQGGLPGWEAFHTALFLEGIEESTGLIKRIIMVSSSLTNFLMIVSAAIFWGRFDSLKRALPWLLILAAILDAQWFTLIDPYTDLRAGYYFWSTSFLVLAVGYFLNQRADRTAKAILPMCVIRRMDAVLEPTKRAVLATKEMLDKASITEQRAALAEAAGQAFYNTSKFTLRDLKSRGSQQQLLADFEDYLNGFSPNVQDTFELKNSLTKQTVEDAVEQYRRDRDPRERLFGFGRCVVHFAVDDSEVRMCTELKGRASWFLPFNKGYNDGAGKVMQHLLKDDTQVYKQFVENESFRRFVGDMVYALTSQ